LILGARSSRSSRPVSSASYSRLRLRHRSSKFRIPARVAARCCSRALAGSPHS
jgi:hypothetical protein